MFSNLDLINKFYSDIYDILSVDSSNLKESVQPNKTSNDYGSFSETEFFRHKAYQIVNQSLICGFKNAESNVDDLNLPLYEKYFAVPTIVDDDEQDKYNEEMTKKSIILYGLYALKQKSSGTKNESFAEYIKKFLSEEPEEDSELSSERSITGLQTGFAFIMLVLKEMRSLNNGQLLINSMEHLYKVLKDVKKGAFIHKDDTKMTMALDINLNEAREFLLELIRDKATTERMTLLAHKIILLIGVARSSVEDLLVLCSVL